jgi:thiazole synthase ThiGH ThiG subunit
MVNDTTKLTLTPVHSRLAPDAVEAIEVCNALYRKGFFVNYEEG